MVIRPKTPEIIQAQVGAYLADMGEYGFNLLADINELPAEPLMKRGEDFIKGGSPNPLNPKNYLKFLTENNGQHHHSIQYWREKLECYEPFRDDVARLRQSTDTQDENPGLVGSGRKSDVYWHEQDQHAYTIRLVKRSGLVADQIVQHVAGLELGQDQPNLEQLVAAWPKDGVTISEFVPGKTLANFQPNDWDKIQTPHLSQLVGTIAMASSLNIDVDPDLSNLIFNFDTENFTIIDYRRSYDPHLNKTAKAIGGLSRLLLNSSRNPNLKLLSPTQLADLAHKLGESIECTLDPPDIEMLNKKYRFAL